MGAALLLGLAGLVLGNAEALHDDQAAHPRRQLALKAPVSLYERFQQSGYRGAQERFAFYELAARFEGARVLVPEPVARRHRWYLERVARVLVDVSSTNVPVPKLSERRPADFVGRLDRREVQFWTDAGADYVLVEVAKKGPLLWVPRRWMGAEP